MIKLLITLTLLLSSISIQPVFAGKIYQCKTSHGKTSFQDKPCTNSQTQKLIKTTQTISKKRLQTDKVIKKTHETEKNKLQENKCFNLGKSVFDKSIPQEFQQPHSAIMQCEKSATEAMKTDTMCLELCFQSWYEQYKIEYNIK